MTEEGGGDTVGLGSVIGRCSHARIRVRRGRVVRAVRVVRVR